MKTWQKATIGAGVVLVLGGMAWFSAYQANKGVVAVQTGHVMKADLTSIVTASGEIRPKNYTNVLGEGIGKITEIVVKEGDHVKKGDILLRLENIQPGADVQAQQAAIDSTEASGRAPAGTLDYAVGAMGATAARPGEGQVRLGTRAAALQRAADRQIGLRCKQSHLRCGFSRPERAEGAGGTEPRRTRAVAIQSGSSQCGAEAYQGRAAEDDLRRADRRHCELHRRARGRKRGARHPERRRQFPDDHLGHEHCDLRGESGRDR